MDDRIRKLVATLDTKDDKRRMAALQELLELTETRVAWIYDVWDPLLSKLDSENSYQRSIAIKLLCNLAKSDSQKRLKSDIGRVLAHTADEKFITSRQCIQSVWKLAAAGRDAAAQVADHLEERFAACKAEKHPNLLRQDIVGSMSALSHLTGNRDIIERVKKLIQTEENAAYRKRYAAVLSPE